MRNLKQTIEFYLEQNDYLTVLNILNEEGYHISVVFDTNHLSYRVKYYYDCDLICTDIDNELYANQANAYKAIMQLYLFFLFLVFLLFTKDLEE